MSESHEPERPPSEGPPRGWYPDPQRPGEMRWWDGRAWKTGTEAPGEGPPSERANSGDDGHSTAPTSGMGNTSVQRPTQAGVAHSSLLLAGLAVLTFMGAVPFVIPAALAGASLYWAWQSGISLNRGNLSASQQQAELAATWRRRTYITGLIVAVIVLGGMVLLLMLAFLAGF